jgi:central glycolytic genes regulator
MQRLRDEGAVGEVFGLFFNAGGEIVGRIPGLGLYLENLSKRAHHVIVIAGGKHKADAIVAVVGNHQRDLLVLDEGSARRILEIFGDGETRDTIVSV